MALPGLSGEAGLVIVCAEPPRPLATGGVPAPAARLSPLHIDPAGPLPMSGGFTHLLILVDRNTLASGSFYFQYHRLLPSVK